MIFLLYVVLMFFMLSCSKDEATETKKPTVLIFDLNILEGDHGRTMLDFPIALQEVFEKDITLNYKSDDGSAFQELDYKAAKGIITIPAGTKEVNIPLEIVSDKIKEGHEIFRILLDLNDEVEFNTRTAQILISNDDSELPYDNDDYSTPSGYQGWSLVWADEFDGTNINTNYWTHEIGNGDGGWGNNELEYYTDAEENSRIEDGKLVIEARDDSWNDKKYTSARMITKEKFAIGFSRTDIRAKLPYGQGIWPALWMLGNDVDSKGWPACGEIDIMELIGNAPSTSHATVHWGVDFPSHKYVGQSYSLSREKFKDRFHVFSVVREYNQMWFYVDDILIFEFSSKDLQGQPNPFNQQFFYIFNVAIGGNWPGNPDETTVFPQKMEVDYIRVFEKIDED